MKHAIGIDVGGSKLGLAVVAESGRILAHDQVPTEAGMPFLQRLPGIMETLESLLARASMTLDSCEGIGIGCPGPLDLDRGLVLNRYTLPGWDHAGIVDAFSKRAGMPVSLENDADAALMGEVCAGSGQGCQDLVMLTLGTGVGGAALTQGKLYRGKRGEHPEIGHIPVDRSGPACYCGTQGCLESLASGEGIGNQGLGIGLSDAAEVFMKAGQGNREAQAIIDRAVSALESATWTLIHTFLPERLILGGGVLDHHPDLFLDPLREQARKTAMVSTGPVEVVRASLGNSAGVVGAASLVFRATN
jgi:glucokinase